MLLDGDLGDDPVGSLDDHAHAAVTLVLGVEAEVVARAGFEVVQQGRRDAIEQEQARRRKIANDLKKCENEISRLEAEGESLDTEISLPENSTDPDKLRELTAKREAVDEKLASLYEQWESLSELAEEE